MRDTIGLRYIIFFVIISYFFSCDNTKSSDENEDKIIAQIGTKKLFYSQMSNLISEGISPVDSASIVEGFVQSWIRENLMLQEAEKKIASDININKLVEDYRSSLLVYNFEKQLVEDYLDTIITLSEKQAFYNANKPLYTISHPILKCVWAAVGVKSSYLSPISRALESNQIDEAIELITEGTVKYWVDTSTYLTFQELMSKVPLELNQSELKAKKLIKKRVGESEYFVKILELYDENTNPPFDYIEVKIEKTILSERKNTLLKNFRDQLYDKAKDNNKFHVY